MDMFFQGAMIALIVTAIAVTLDYVKLWTYSSYYGQSDGEAGYQVASGITNFVVLTVTNWIILYFYMPARTGIFWGWSWLLIDVLLTLIVFSLFSMGHRQGRLSVLVFGLILAWAALWNVVNLFAPFSTEAAKELVGLIEVVDAPESEYPETDPSHIVLVNRAIAEFRANQFMATGGEFRGRNLETVFQPLDPNMQQVNGHLYWIVDLCFEGWREAGQIDNVSPGYIVIDAENPDARPEFRDEFEVKYTPCGYFAEDLHRHIYRAGYTDYQLDDVTLEVDDNWQPIYTVALNRPVQWQYNKGSSPMAFLTIDAQTGEIVEYALDEVPAWVDRVYSEETVERLLTYWGRWNFANRRIIGESKGNRFSVAGDPGLVYTSDGRAVWQVLMTSMGAATSASSVILVDARTGAATRYNTESGVAIESNVVDVMRATTANVRRHEPVNPQLYRIYGELSWVATYVPNDEYGAAASFAGVGIVPAGTTDPSSVAYSAASFEDALRLYRRTLADAEVEADPNRESSELVVEGVIVEVASAVINGNEVFYIRLDGDAYTYIGPVGANSDLPFAAVGQIVRMRFIDVGNPNGEVDIVTYERLRG